MRNGYETMKTGGRHGFTLRELTTLIAIAVILLGMMAPALGEARRASRMTMDLLDLMQHAVLKENYVAANKGRMPNAPPGTGQVNGADFGPPDRPTRAFAHPDFPHNGWAMTPGYTHNDVWRQHHIAFGEYLVDGEGLDILDEVFASSGAHQFIDESRAWRTLRSGDFDDEYPDEFGPTPGPVSGQGRNIYSSLDNSAWMISPSYRYTVTALYGDSEIVTFDCIENFWTGVHGSFWCGGSGGVGSGWGQSSWSKFRAYVQASDFVFPSRKVMFWSIDANHNRGVRRYTEPGADVPIVMIDGSVRVSRPFEEMPIPGSQEHLEALSMGEPWAASPDHRWGSDLFVTPTSQQFAWFAATIQGPGGYDFRENKP